MVFDEVKIKHGLVFEPHSLQIIGFELSDEELLNLSDIFREPRKDRLETQYVTISVPCFHIFQK